MSSTFKNFSFTKIGSVCLSGPRVRLTIWCFQLSEESIITHKYLVASFSLIDFFIGFDGNIVFRWLKDEIIKLFLSMLSDERLTFSHR